MSDKKSDMLKAIENLTAIAESMHDQMNHTEARLKSIEKTLNLHQSMISGLNSRIPVEPESPTEGSKVVGYITEDMAQKRVKTGHISEKPEDEWRVPVILQSEHEEEIGKVSDKLQEVSQEADDLRILFDDANATIAEQVAENERLENYEQKYRDMVVMYDNQREYVERLRKKLHKIETEGIGCADCDDTGWREDRAGRYVCPCVDETEAYQELKAENERLTEQGDDLERRAIHAEVRVQSLEAQRDAYADPANWASQWTRNAVGSVIAVRPAYVGPTPADPEPEPESVEGEVTTSWSTGDRVSIDAFGALWPEGTRVRITRLPETGGNDGE